MAAWLDRYWKVITIALVAAVAAAAVAFVLDQRADNEPLTINLADPAPTGPIEVYITGAVEQPGVYEMQDGDRIIDLLYEAGGHSSNADLESINLALRLHDEDQVLVPRIGDAGRIGEPTGGLVSSANGPEGDRKNINAASASELDDLPGIGEVYSERIVQDRLTNGSYVTTEELVERKILPRATYERIAEMITVGP